MSIPSDDKNSLEIPLIIDVDGTLIKTDLLIEAIFALAARTPLTALKAAMTLRHGKARMKAEIASHIEVDVAQLPLNEDLLLLIRQEKAKGRKIYLASASNHRYVAALAAHLGLFDGVFASDARINLAGTAKAEALCRAFGAKGFDYAGDAPPDLKVWAVAREAWVVNATPALLEKARKLAPNLRQVGSRQIAAKTYLKAARLHQWLKNLLIFVPALGAHQLTNAMVNGIMAFMSFSLCASSVYLLNDLLDLKNDRDHPTKRRRPFASGTIPLLHGIFLCPLFLFSSLGIAVFLPWKFAAVLMVYYILTLAYSFRLKKIAVVDVVTLACLYGVRLVAGGAACLLALSSWLGAFAIFLFLSLALVKRCTELIERITIGKGDPAGHGYRLTDLPMLEGMSIASGYVSVLVMALYINSPEVAQLYTHPNRLWLICVVLIYWLSRILLLTHRDEMHEDPVVFAVTDRTSMACGLLIVAIVLVSV